MAFHYRSSSRLKVVWYTLVNLQLGRLRSVAAFFVVKVSSRVKNHDFSKFAIFTWLNRANQELSFEKNSRKKCFFCADLWSAKVFSMLIILIDRWQVLSYLIRMSLLNQANHAIWQKSWSTSIVRTVFPWILEVNASNEEKKACPFSYTAPRRKRTTKSFCKEWASNLAESDKGYYYNQEKWVKDDKAPEKHWNHCGIEFNEVLSEQGKLFWPWSGQASDEVARGPAPYKNRTKDCFESLL